MKVLLSRDFMLESENQLKDELDNFSDLCKQKGACQAGFPISFPGCKVDAIFIDGGHSFSVVTRYDVSTNDVHVRLTAYEVQ